MGDEGGKGRKRKREEKKEEKGGERKRAKWLSEYDLNRQIRSLAIKIQLSSII